MLFCKFWAFFRHIMDYGNSTSFGTEEVISYLNNMFIFLIHTHKTFKSFKNKTCQSIQQSKINKSL